EGDRRHPGPVLSQVGERERADERSLAHDFPHRGPANRASASASSSSSSLTSRPGGSTLRLSMKQNARCSPAAVVTYPESEFAQRSEPVLARTLPSAGVPFILRR